MKKQSFILQGLSLWFAICMVLAGSAYGQACYPPPNTTMVAWYSFDNPAPFANIATNNLANSTSPPSPTSGKVGGAAHFNGVDRYVDAPSTIDTNFGPAGNPFYCSGDDSSCSGDFSVDLWIEVPANLTNSVTTILDKRVDNGTSINGYSVALSFSRLILQLADGGGFTNYASLALPNLKGTGWHHVAVTVRRTSHSGIRFYYDGVQVATADPTDRMGSLLNKSVLRIGANTADSAFDNFFNGDMDELEIYNRVLTATEVAGIYNAQSSGKCKP